jgi:transposase
MDERSRRTFTKEFKTETVRLIRGSDQPIAQICRDMGLSEGTVQPCVPQARIDAGHRDGLTTSDGT